MNATEARRVADAVYRLQTIAAHCQGTNVYLAEEARQALVSLYPLIRAATGRDVG